MEKPEPLKKLTIRIERRKPAMWDCDSTLYDSVEVKSFERHLDSAIASRTLSMPHLPDRRSPTDASELPPAVAPPPAHLASNYKKPSKISRSLHKLLRSISIFKSKLSSSNRQLRDGVYVLYDKSGALTTIPEAPEIDHLASLSPEVNSSTKRTASERFTATSVGISCA